MNLTSSILEQFTIAAVITIIIMVCNGHRNGCNDHGGSHWLSMIDGEPMVKVDDGSWAKMSEYGWYL